MTASTLTNLLSGLLISVASLVAAEIIWEPPDRHFLAQYFTIPNLSFPDSNGQWGCKFYNSCED